MAQSIVDEIADTIFAYRSQLQERDNKLQQISQSHQKVNAERDGLKARVEELTKRVDELVLEKEALKPNPATAPKAKVVGMNGAEPAAAS